MGFVNNYCTKHQDILKLYIYGNTNSFNNIQMRPTNYEQTTLLNKFATIECNAPVVNAPVVIMRIRVMWIYRHFILLKMM